MFLLTVPAGLGLSYYRKKSEDELVMEKQWRFTASRTTFVLQLCDPQCKKAHQKCHQYLYTAIIYLIFKFLV